jgi:glycosyltransferase involved in cell wall biosynthesis
MFPRLFFIINSLEGGGAERVITNLANEFSKKNYQVSMVCLNKAPLFYALSEDITLFSLVSRKQSSGLFYRSVYAFLTFVNLFKLLYRERPDHAISFMTTANLWTGIVCSILNIPYVVSERITPDYTVNRQSYFLKWLSFLVYKNSKSIVIPAQGMLDGFRKNELFKTLDNFTTIYNPVNKFEQKPSDRVHQGKYILAVGRLDYQKGFDVLINAFSKLRHLDLDLLISGEGSQRDALLLQINSLGLQSRVKLLGFKTNLQDYYLQSDFFVLSSRNEGYPNALVEAMSLGCACIATDCEFGPAEIIEDRVNGLLVPPGDVNALATAMTELAANPLLKKRIAKNARLINTTNSIEIITQRWEKLIFSHG